MDCSLVNPNLAELSLEDLNQRYRDTYVVYNGQPSYIVAFDMPGSVLNIHLNTGPHWNIRSVTQFDYRLLNCARPTSRWYSCQMGRDTVPVLLSYRFSRQWARGCSNRNTALFQVTNAFKMYGDIYLYHPILADKRSNYPKKLVFPTEAYHYSPRWFSILAPGVLAVRILPTVYSVYLRAIRIADLHKNENNIKANILQAGFEQEIKDIISPQYYLSFYSDRKTAASPIDLQQQLDSLRDNLGGPAPRVREETIFTAANILDGNVNARVRGGLPPGGVPRNPTRIAEMPSSWQNLHAERRARRLTQLNRNRDEASMLGALPPREITAIATGLLSDYGTALRNHLATDPAMLEEDLWLRLQETGNALRRAELPPAERW